MGQKRSTSKHLHDFSGTRAHSETVNDEPTGRETSEEVFSLLYMSEATAPFAEPSLQRLAVQAAANNVLLDVTGYLLYRNARFTQYLEGPRHEVLSLLDKISTDNRHRMMTVAELGTDARRFPGWSMRQLDPLWYPISGPFDAVDELLSMNAHSHQNDDTARESLVGLVARIGRLGPY